MGTRVVRIQASDARAPLRVRRVVDPAGTALMVAISGTVLAATLLVASMSSGGGSRSLSPSAAQGPEPAPPPTWAAPERGSGPVSP